MVSKSRALPHSPPPKFNIFDKLVNFLREDFILKEAIHFELDVQYPNLKRSLLKDTNHCFKKGKRLWEQGQQRKSKKNILHGIRYFI